MWVVIYGKGKEKQEWIDAAVKKLGGSVRVFLEPSTGPIGNLLVSLMKSQKPPHSRCLKFLLIADKYYQVYEQILPLLDSGINVVCSWRFVWKGEDQPTVSFFCPTDEKEFKEWLNG